MTTLQISEEEFASSVSPYNGLVADTKHVRDYYRAFGSDSWFVCGRFVRGLVRSLGYHNVLNSCLGERILFDGGITDEDAKTSPDDMVIRLPGGLFGGRISGNLDVRDLVDPSTGEIKSELMSIATKDLIENYLIPLGKRSSAGKNTGWDIIGVEFNKRSENDVTDVFFRHAVRSVQTASGDHSKFGVYPNALEDLDMIKRFCLRASKFIEGDSPGEYNLGRIQTREGFISTLDKLRPGLGEGIYQMLRPDLVW